MFVQELSELHQRYVDLSGRFRANWAFHQFMQSVRKILSEDGEILHTKDFQEVYARLKELSENLNTFDTARIATRLEAVGQELTQLTAYLLGEDTKVLPHFVRQFFQRVKSYDERILTQLVRFYLYACREEDWTPDRFDKVDFLLSRLAEEDNGPGGRLVLKDQSRLREILQAMWSVMGQPQPTPEQVDQHKRSIEQIRWEVGQVVSLDELHERRLIGTYRDRKRSLGLQLFYPEIALAFLATNLELKKTILQLYRNEEQRIVSEYQRIFQLEQAAPSGGELRRELVEFRNEVERFEGQLKTAELRLDELAGLRRRMRTLLPRLTELQAADEGKVEAGGVSEDLFGIPHLEVKVPSSCDPLLAETYTRMVGALESASPGFGPSDMALSPEIYALRLEPREVQAFLHREDPAVDTELETFVLEAAALRIQINDHAEEIKDLLDETSATGDGPVFARARTTLRLANRRLAQFAPLVDQAVLDGQLEEAQQLQLLRIRLMRDYSGLWLLAFKPFVGKVAGVTGTGAGLASR